MKSVVYRHLQFLQHKLDSLKEHMPLLSTLGAASTRGYGQSLGGVNYIEDVFSTYLYTGTGATQTITNGINLSGKGGLVWGKSRDVGTYVSHNLFDTVSGFTKILYSNNTNAQNDLTSDGAIALSNGFTIKAGQQDINSNTKANVSWTFRKQPKFFDVVTYTGTGSATTFAHNLGSAPGCMIVKCTSTGGTNWRVYHRSLTSAAYNLKLNLTSAEGSEPSVWNSTAPTSTVFSVGADPDVNNLGDTYVAYLFAHDAGGFGLSGTDNVISCGSFTTSAGGIADINLGYEPQFVMIKRTNNTGSWIVLDTMRGFNLDVIDATLFADQSAVETANQERGRPTATGFYIPSNYGNSSTYIYIAIRRGPMKVPTLGTSVFIPQTRSGTASAATVTGVGFAPDLTIFNTRNRAAFAWNFPFCDRLRGPQQQIHSNTTAAEAKNDYGLLAYTMDGMSLGNDGTDSGINYSTSTYVDYFFKRAPGFFDEVCYTGTGAALVVPHNLGVVPELIITKPRSSVGSWTVTKRGVSPSILFGNNLDSSALLNYQYVGSLNTTTFVAGYANTNYTSTNGVSYVAYLFGSCPGVSKVNFYTGTGTTKQIDCGFTGGARFVLIKRYDPTGDRYVWDTARGIIAGNDPYLLLNSTAAEVTSTDYIDTYSAGFEISSTAPAAINASDGLYIFLAIA